MKKSLGLLVGALILATAAFWATLVTDPPKTEAETIGKYDVGEALKTASSGAPLQDAGVIACTYVLTDGHRCN
jgi:hypothetical protein